MEPCRPSSFSRLSLLSKTIASISPVGLYPLKPKDGLNGPLGCGGGERSQTAKPVHPLLHLPQASRLLLMIKPEMLVPLIFIHYLSFAPPISSPAKGGGMEREGVAPGRVPLDPALFIPLLTCRRKVNCSRWGHGRIRFAMQSIAMHDSHMNAAGHATKADA